MKTHYGVLLISAVINFIMACSLNSFSDSTLYMPVLFLYFLSNLATFIDKYVTYKDMKQNEEQCVSLICIILSAIMIFLYISDSLNFLEIYFKEEFGKFHMLMQGVPNSFYTFNSVDITAFVFIIAVVMPAAYVLLCVASWLRELGYTIEILKNILIKKVWTILNLCGVSVLLGITGCVYCHYKYQRECEGFGKPQYVRYFVAIFVISLIIEMIILIKRNKDILEEKVPEDKGNETLNESM